MLHTDISVIVPTAGRNNSGLLRALDSVAGQDLGPFTAEVVVIPNGAKLADARDATRAWADDHPGVTVRIFSNATPGAGRARNIGLATAIGSYITFLDDDDELAPGYLRAGLEAAVAADSKTIVALPLQEFNADGSPVSWSPLAQRLRLLKVTPIPARDTPWLLGFNASKIMPREVATAFRFPEHLRSGEDVAYFLQFLAIEDLKVVRATEEKAAYRRHLGADSVSRQEMSYDFNVTQRLECVAEMRDTPVAPVNEQARETQVNSQYRFVLRYLEEHPEHAAEVVADLARLELADFPWPDVPSTAPESLVISYCFPPFADPAGYVAAKQIAQNSELVDVISADMSAIRRTDVAARTIAARHIRQQYISPSPASFSYWPAIATFGRNALRQALRFNPSGYKRLRSRAMWSGSHVAAALYKDKFPQVRWTAEFSDPMRFGVTGEPRRGLLVPGKVTRTLRSMLRKYPELARKVSTHFDLVEFVTMVSADEVVFTNAHQRTVMLADYPEGIRHLILAKSSIAAQPLPLPELVVLGTPANVFSDPGLTHIAYFGSFYSSRGIGEIFSALRDAPDDVRSGLKLHIFTSKPGVVALEARKLGLADTVEAHEALDYLNFLATAAQADVLFVADAETRAHFPVNPFLPSKLSDYLGTGVPVWAHVEPGSTLSGVEVEHQSVIRDTGSIQSVLASISRRKSTP